MAQGPRKYSVSPDPGESGKLNRTQVQVMIVSEVGELIAQLRPTLASLGYAKVAVATHTNQALDKMKERRFNLVFFDSRKGTSVHAEEIIKQVVRANAEEYAIAVSTQPQVDDLFGLLKLGARGYLVTPFTPDSVDTVIERAFVAPPFCDAIFEAADRNSALAAGVINNLDRLAAVMRHAREFFSAKKDSLIYSAELHASADLAAMFCENHDHNKLREAYFELCLRRGDGPATRIGRLRVQLKKEKEERMARLARPKQKTQSQQ
jgi:DNA-binding NarL/FixJ family response regulator